MVLEYTTSPQVQLDLMETAVDCMNMQRYNLPLLKIWLEPTESTRVVPGVDHKFINP